MKTVKVKSYPRLIKDHYLKMYEGAEVWFNSFSTAALNGRTSHPAVFMTVERDAGTHSIRGCVEGWED
jgi:hypothetical protein